MFSRTFSAAMATLALVAVSAGVSWAAEPKEDLAAAVKKLADSSNYSWTTTVQTTGGRGGGRGGRGPAGGMTDKAGYTTFTLTMMQNPYEVVIPTDPKGAAVVKMEDGWKTVAELQKAGEAAGGGFVPETILAAQVTSFATPPAQVDALLNPKDAQGKDLPSRLTNIKVADGTIAADLTEEGAKNLLTFRGGPANPNLQIEVKGAKGTLKVWTKDGAMSKLELHVIGTTVFNENEIQQDRTTTTEIKDVGTTKVSVSDDAKKKISPPATQPAAK